jgi:hypothetical protein
LLDLGILEIGIAINLLGASVSLVRILADVISQIVEVRIKLIVATRFMHSWLCLASFALTSDRSASTSTTPPTARSAAFVLGWFSFVSSKRGLLEVIFDKFGSGDIFTGERTNLGAGEDIL